MSIINFNRKTVSSQNPCISHNDRGFTLGHGLFETILIKKSEIPALDYHWQRLETSAPVLGIALPFSLEELQSMLNELIIKNNLQNKLAGARVTITHGESERGILPVETPQPNFLITVFECSNPVDRPFTALLAATRKNEHSAAAKIKSLSYLDNILARKEAMDQKFDEAILLNTALNVADGSIANVYMVKNNQVFTPSVTDGALPGVVRSILLEEFKQLVSVTEKSIIPDELITADEVFLTNALMGVKSVGRIDNTEFHVFDMANKITQLLRDKKNYI